MRETTHAPGTHHISSTRRTRCQEMPADVRRIASAHLGCSSDELACTLMRAGKYGNANVYRISHGNRTCILKEFLSRTALIRATFGRLLIESEMQILTRLNDLPGIPRGVQRLSPHVLVMDYVQGTTLRDLRFRKTRIPKAFFEELETRLRNIHAKGIVHLDLRNMGNVILGEDQMPWIIDFQTAIRTSALPARLRQSFENVDRSGVYKHWERVCDTPLDEERRNWAEHFQHIRRLWIFRGYWLSRMQRKLRERFANQPRQELSRRS